MEKRKDEMPFMFYRLILFIFVLKRVQVLIFVLFYECFSCNLGLDSQCNTMTEMKFPVTNKFDAKDVTELDYEVDLFKEGLYVNFDELRGTDFINELKLELHIEEDLNIKDKNVLNSPTNQYVKIIFSGHRGCGKTTELKRLHNQINNEDCYFSIFISLEQETYLNKFQPEDLYALIIIKLVERLNDEGISFSSHELDAIAMQWFTTTEEIKKESEKDSKKAGVEAGIGVGFLKFLNLKASFKNDFAFENDFSTEVRRKIKSNPLEIIVRFNVVLNEIRKLIKEKNKGNDILFIIDGSEKMPFNIYQELCLKDSYLLRRINCNIIFSVPINAWYDIESSTSDFFGRYLLPMIKVDDKSIPYLEKIITLRIAEDVFFEDKVLDYIAHYSGGCIRQLIQIVHKCIMVSLGAKITMEKAEKAVKELGQEMRDRLKTEHLKIIEDKDYQKADTAVTDMLFSLALLKYNGTRDINPLLKPFFPEPEAQA